MTNQNDKSENLRKKASRKLAPIVITSSMMLALMSPGVPALAKEMTLEQTPSIYKNHGSMVSEYAKYLKGPHKGHEIRHIAHKHDHKFWGIKTDKDENPLENVDEFFPDDEDNVEGETPDENTDGEEPADEEIDDGNTPDENIDEDVPADEDEGETSDENTDGEEPADEETVEGETPDENTDDEEPADEENVDGETPDENTDGEEPADKQKRWIVKMYQSLLEEYKTLLDYYNLFLDKILK